MKGSQLKQTIGHRIREEREQRGLKQHDLAEAIGIDPPSLSRIEKGSRGIDSLILRRVARLFELPMDAFFESKSDEMAMARRGDAADGSMQEMLDWGLRLHRVGRVVRKELALRG